MSFPRTPPLALLALFLLCSASGCRVAYRTLLGVDITPEWKSQADLERDFRRRDIAPHQQYLLDTASYYHTVRNQFYEDVDALRIDSVLVDSAAANHLRTLAKDNLQPTQIRYFTADGQPIFKMINCYLNPPIPINWNSQDCFDNFPPSTIFPDLNEGNQELAYFLPHLRTVAGEPVTVADLPPADYYAIVFWNDFMVRPSRKLIRTLDQYDRRYPDQTTYFLYVNNHNSQVWTMLNAEQRQMVLDEIAEEQ